MNSCDREDMRKWAKLLVAPTHGKAHKYKKPRMAKLRHEKVKEPLITSKGTET